MKAKFYELYEHRLSISDENLAFEFRCFVNVKYTTNCKDLV